MVGIPHSIDEMPVVPNKKDFDSRQGNFLERLIFNNRLLLIALCVIVTGLLGASALQLSLNPSYLSMIPRSHPFIQNYLANAQSLAGLGNSIRVVVEDKEGNIYSKEYLEALQKVNDAVFLTPGVDRSYVKSLWTPVVRWTEVTEEGFKGGPVMPPNYSGSPASIQQLRINVMKGGLIGSIVANDQRSSMVFAPLLDKDPATGKPLDYSTFARDLEQNVRSLQTDRIHIRVIGFAQLMGDLIAGLMQVMAYFAVAAAIAAAIIFVFTRCLRSTMSIIGCTIVAVIWQLGAVRLLGYSLDPYSILVPFLVFAIGVSHGSQKMNGIMQDIGRGTHRYVAARYTFRRLFLAGLTALLADVGGFAVLTMIDIPVIRGLAVTAAVGVGILIFTNLLLLPVVLSYVGVNPKAAQRSLAAEAHTDTGVLHFFNRFTDWRWATIAILCAVGLGWGAYSVSQQLQIGDLDPGAPELWPNSRYNQDNTYITGHYGLSSDEFAVIVKMPPKGIRSFDSIVEMDRLEQTLRQLDGVQTTFSAASLARMYTSGGFEGYPKWMTISRDYNIFNDSVSYAYIGNPELFNVDGSIAPVVVYLQDHKAATLTRMVNAVQTFAAAHDTPDRKFLLAAGSAGIEAATNIVVSEANDRMLYWVYAAVIVLCFITFRSWRAVVVAILPLVVTSILCEALMVELGIGVKVATLPVLALGVGIGVDYALYLLSIQLKWQREGVPLPEAYARAMRFTGKIVALVGITLASGVVTWAWSPIKFQANMGVLLTFMFVWNMIGALVLIPALSRFLLPTSHFRNKSKSSLA